MKKIIIILSLVINMTATFAQTPIKYIHSNQDSIEDQELKAIVNEKVYTIISKKDTTCLNVELIADFNKDGYDDVLIEIVNGCGGNCCGDSYIIYCFDGKTFRESKSVGYDWDGIEISESSLGFNFIIETVPMGVSNTEMCNNLIETYQFKDYDFDLISIIKENKLQAITEFKSSDFEGRENEEMFLSYDLDSDGKVDKITCLYWERWGTIRSWNIEFGNGKKFEADSTPKRIGVLNTKTNNVYDIVIECDTILKWNGDKYE